MPPYDGNSKLPAADLATLHHLVTLLHLFDHRNKNQHRRSIWYRHFSTFRRQLKLLYQDMEALQSVPETHLQRIRKSKKDPIRQERVFQRSQLWLDAMVPKWHRAFSQIVADRVFATLGIVLLAVLAQVCGLMGVTERFEELGQEEVERVIGEFGSEYWAMEAEQTAVNVGDRREDLGEVIAREEDVAESVIVTPAVGEQAPLAKVSKRKQEAIKSDKKGRKKRKKTNAIDDLFDSLD